MKGSCCGLGLKHSVTNTYIGRWMLLLLLTALSWETVEALDEFT